MKTSSSLLLGSCYSILLVSAQASGDAIDVVKRGAEKRIDQATFDRESTSLVKQGLCRVYRTTGSAVANANLSLELCKRSCPKDSDGYSCPVFLNKAGKPELTYRDPQGRPYHLGRCKCGANPIMKTVGVFVATEAMPAIAAATCAVWLKVAELTFDIGTAIVPGGAGIKGLKGAIDAAKMVKKVGGTAADLGGLVGKLCNPKGDQQALVSNIMKAFDPLSAMKGDGYKAPEVKKWKPPPVKMETDAVTIPDRHVPPPYQRIPPRRRPAHKPKGAPVRKNVAHRGPKRAKRETKARRAAARPEREM